MIIFLYGKDSYRIKEQMDNILAGYLKKNASGINIFKFDFEDVPANDRIKELEETIKTMPFFEEKKIMIVKNIFSSSVADKLPVIMEHWQLAKDQGLILMISETLDDRELAKKNKKLWELLKSKSEIIKAVEPLEGAKLTTWVKTEFKNRGVEAEMPAIRKLVEYVSDGSVNDSSWRLIQEIDKLANYVQNKTATEKDVEIMVTTRSEQQIFPILDSIGEKNQIRAFTLLYQNMSAGMDPWYIFSMIAYQFRNILSMKSLSKEPLPFPEIAKKSGLNPYVARKAFDQAKKYDLEELKQKFSRLAEIEIATKNGLADITDEVYGLIF